MKYVQIRKFCSLFFHGNHNIWEIFHEWVSVVVHSFNNYLSSTYSMLSIVPHIRGDTVLSYYNVVA